MRVPIPGVITFRRPTGEDGSTWCLAELLAESAERSYPLTFVVGPRIGHLRSRMREEKGETIDQGGTFAAADLRRTRVSDRYV